MMHRMETIWVLETTLDDLSPQIVGYVLERALALGALDAYAAAVQMKKQRPGVLLTILSRAEEREVLLDLLLLETTTLGVRVTSCERAVLDREIVRVPTPYGEIAVKVAGEKAKPEYEDCRAAALRHRVPLQKVLGAAQRAADEFVMRG